MTSDVSRVYQFLAKQGDWVAAADTNSDGTVIKSEFRTFMEENFEWDGETTEEGKNDLINNFWKTIDSKQTGSISGTNLKNKNALDSNEIAAMDKKLAYYEILNDFTADLSAPSVVSDSANWKKSVSAGLAALVEKYTGAVEELAAYLEEQSVIIEAKATADYCANDYLNTEMATLVKEYGYAYADDTTLQGMIDSYIQNIPEDADAYEIQQTVVSIIDAYLATAGLKEDNAFDLSQYGYSPNDTAGLNDLQKSVLKKTLETDLASGDLKEDYEANSDLFATAIESYINELKFGDFETVSTDVLGSFKSSEAYKNVEKNIQVQNLLVSDEFRSALTTNISETIADTIISDGKYLTVMKEIEAEALKKAENGDFDVNGALDTQTAINWLVEQVSARLAEFYPNGFGDMSLDELNVMYDKLVESANKESDTDKQLELLRDAAIQYCNALAQKSDKFAEIVKAAFGDSYATEIAKMYPSEINEIITELKAQAAELGDANELTLVDSSWGSLPTQATNTLNLSKDSAIKFIDSKLEEVKNGTPRIRALRESIKLKVKINQILGDNYKTAINNITDIETLTSKMNEINALFEGEDWAPTTATTTEVADTITLGQGTTKSFNITPSFTDKDGNTKTITTDRITYKSSNTSLATIDANGNVTINGNTLGTYTVTLTVMVDGVEVGQNTITVKCQDQMDLSSVNTNFESKPISEHLSSGKTAICLSGFTTWDNAKNNAKTSITNYVNKLVDILKTAGYDATRLQKAATTTINYYTACIDAIYDHGADSKYENYNNLEFSYLDANGNTCNEDSKYSQKTRKREKDAGRTGVGAENIDHNSTGIRMNESYAGTNTYEYYLNVGVLLEKFQNFYNIL